MRLTLIDRIVELEPGRRIQAAKCLSLSEGYLRDHFPRFPIMPGVLMLESMYQAAAWLVRATDDFASSLVLLREANNVKYSDFVQPGQTLVVTAEIVKREGQRFTLKCQGEMGDVIAVRGRLVLEAENVPAGDRPTDAAAVNGRIVHSLREKFRLLYRPAPSGSTP